jgi:uncharacterized membrane protein
MGEGLLKLYHSKPFNRVVNMIIDLILVTLWVLGLFAFAGGIAWLADQVASFHLAGMERVRKLQEKEREGAR